VNEALSCNTDVQFKAMSDVRTKLGYQNYNAQIAHRTAYFQICGAAQLVLICLLRSTQHGSMISQSRIGGGGREQARAEK
jgi:hypothetical protein